MNKAFSKMNQEEYQDALAIQYRESDIAAVTDPNVTDLSCRLKSITEKNHFKRVLEVGCGTGRYFHAVKNADEFVGIDPSQNMLNEAHTPILQDRITIKNRILEKTGFLEYVPSAPFDFIFSFGVMGEHIPFDDKTARHAFELLAHGGQFYFTVVDPFSSVAYAGKQFVKKIFRVFGIAKQLRFMNTTAFAWNTKNGVANILKRNGFNIISVERVQKGYPHYLFLAQKILG